MADTSTESDRLLDAVIAHVPFDGWSEKAFAAAISDTQIQPALGRALFPRGPVDLALAYHRRGDTRLRQALSEADLDHLRFRERVAFAVRKRLELNADKELVRNATTLFALPHHAADGARAIWETADTIWNALGDKDRDYNWYTKRLTLSGVISSTVLFWLGDASEENAATWAFLDRRIDGVMQFEKVKAQVRGNKLAQLALWGPKQALSLIKAPSATRTGTPVGLPGRRG